MDIMMRLNNISLGLEALRNKTEMNRQMAEDAKELANNATLEASSLQEVDMQHDMYVFALYERREI